MLPGGGDLLTAEISEKQARSIKYQMTIAKLPLAKELPSRQIAAQSPAGLQKSSTSTRPRSTRPWSATWPPVTSSIISATSC